MVRERPQVTRRACACPSQLMAGRPATGQNPGHLSKPLASELGCKVRNAERRVPCCLPRPDLICCQSRRFSIPHRIAAGASSGFRQSDVAPSGPDSFRDQRAVRSVGTRSKYLQRLLPFSFQKPELSCGSAPTSLNHALLSNNACAASQPCDWPCRPG